MSESAKQLRVMLVAECCERAQVIQRSLHAHQVVAWLTGGIGLYEQVVKLQPDLVIAAVDSPDRDILENMRAITSDHPRPMLMFSADAERRTIEAAVQAGINAYVVDGLHAERVIPVLEVAIARFNQIQSMRRELAEARASLAGRKSIERAKGILMKRLEIDEESAYSALRKMAMNRNLKIVELASSLITASELLLPARDVFSELLENQTHEQ
jgi:response regulator NasT